jgi:hypothetical protein
MTLTMVAAAVGIATLVSGLFGLYLQRVLPEAHSVDKAREMIGAVTGLVTLLLALVLGTIVGSAYYFSAGQQSELQTLSANYLLLDKALAQYGAETKPARDRLKEGLIRNYQLIWGGGSVEPKDLTVASALAKLKPLEDYIGSLDPKTPSQTRAVGSASAKFAAIEQTRILMSLQISVPFARDLLVIVAIWSSLLFCGFGLLSRANATTVTALTLGSFAVGGAVFLILELSSPYTGLFRISPAAIEQTIDALDK